jgi:hypothetical protein
MYIERKNREQKPRLVALIINALQVNMSDY